jgi:hypothetical protein
LLEVVVAVVEHKEQVEPVVVEREFHLELEMQRASAQVVLAEITQQAATDLLVQFTSHTQTFVPDIHSLDQQVVQRV